MTASHAGAALPAGEGAPAVLRFEEGLPGWPESREWELVRHPDADPLLWLRSRHESAVALLLLDPRAVVPDYVPALPRRASARLGLRPEDRPLVFCVVNLGGGPQGPTLNLRAPLVIHPGTLRGAQIILERDDLPLARPILDMDEGP